MLGVPVFLMDFEVLLKIGTGHKFLGADAAPIRFVSRVNPLVSDQITRLAKGFSAALEVAGVWLGVVVRPHMLLERRVLHECFRAHITAIKR